jgi:DNA-binding LacI/PurR family transcriptional regulator
MKSRKSGTNDDSPNGASASASDRGQPKARAVIRDVARLAGVSYQTVSRVINDQPKVAPETRARVVEAIRQLDYRPHSAARTLTTGRSRTIGVITFGVTDYGPSAVLQSLSQAAEEAGYFVNVVVLRALGKRAILDAVERLSDQGVDGLVTLAPRRSLGAALLGVPHGPPMIALDDSLDDSVAVVATDEAGGARTAVEHLLQLGHMTVWHIAGPTDWIVADERQQGWRQALEDAGATANEPLRGDWSAASGYQAGVLLASTQTATAIFAANDQMALGALLALHEAGKRIPGDVSVVGFDGSPEGAYFHPPLTSVRPDFAETGKRCIELMLDLISSGSNRRERVVVPTSLIVRRSSGRAPA